MTVTAAWLLTVFVLGYPGDITPVEAQTFGFPDAQACRDGETETKAWAESKNLIIVTGCHHIFGRP